MDTIDEYTALSNGAGLTSGAGMFSSGESMGERDEDRSFEIDELDIALAAELEKDARQSNPELAAKLGVSSSTIRRKLKRLVDAKAINFFTIPSITSLDLLTVALFGIKASPGQADVALRDLQSLRSARYSALYIGYYDIVMMGIFRDRDELVNFIDGDLATVPSIVSVDMILRVKNVKSSWRYLGGSFDTVEEPRPRKLDKYEKNLVRFLEINPRESITNLSKLVGLNRILVGRKLQNLLSEHTLKVVGVIDPVAFGFHSVVVILVAVRPGKVGMVTQTLALCPKVHHITIISGRFNVILWAVLRNPQELYAFLRDDLGGMEGVVHYEAMYQMRRPKRDFALSD